MIARWFDAHGRALVLYARLLLVNSAAAEDVVQNLFVRLLTQSAGTDIDPPPNPSAWLHKCLRNACLDERRGRVRRNQRERTVAMGRPSWFEPRPDDLVDAALAQKALQSLPDPARQVLTLRIWSGLTLSEVADVTGLPVSTIHDHYRRGLAAVRSVLESNAASLRSRYVEPNQ